MEKIVIIIIEINNNVSVIVMYIIYICTLYLHILSSSYIRMSRTCVYVCEYVKQIRRRHTSTRARHRPAAENMLLLLQHTV